MTRTEGAKNKPKSVKQLVSMLQAAAEKEGIELTLDVKEKIANAAGELAGKVGDDAAAAVAAIKSKFESLEIELDDTEIDTYTCGSCHNSMGTEMPVCPNCGAKLKW